MIGNPKGSRAVNASNGPNTPEKRITLNLQIRPCGIKKYESSGT